MALVLENLDEEIAPEEIAEMGSLNHGYLQIKIGAHFLNEPNLTPSSEFTLDISDLPELPGIEFADIPNSLEPDIAVFNDLSIDFQNDVIKGREIPVLAIEILSPRQGAQTLVDKFKLYFALGVHSCWLVYPHAKAIAVYHTQDDFTLFSQSELVDDKVNVRLPLDRIFS